MCWSYYGHNRKIFPNGDVIDSNNNLIQPYVSTNGLSYQLVYLDNGSKILNRLDTLLAGLFIPIPVNLIGKKLTVRYKNGIIADCQVDNLEWIEDVEVWFDINLEMFLTMGYKISSWGRVMLPSGEITCGTVRNGYRAITLRTVENERKMLMIHRIVAQTFLGNILNSDINHIDGDKTNNRYDNLEIVSRKENNQHAIYMGLRKTKLNDITEVMVKNLLIQFDGSIVKVLEQLKLDGITDISETVISQYKKRLINEGYSFTVKFVKKFTLDSETLTREMLLKTDGDVGKVYENIHNIYPELTIKNIASIKAKMKIEGNTFTDRKHNRKITESERAELIEILKENNNSPSATFDYLQRCNKFPHITIHDLKYLKRKYIKNEDG